MITNDVFPQNGNAMARMTVETIQTKEDVVSLFSYFFSSEAEMILEQSKLATC